ncbi:fxsA cytoplasmic membrane family protein [Rhodococcus sp. MTM3W5.2]|uniref:FxsA family protein n=1 Tax=Rhodococcus sp. MTM3W5.2 TaxID=1805827 RepID=UPI0009790F32|nr:FxsA family protein [Rhodococcus sp. MTM3W5.2]AQA22301.1 fxsA cytoplasmic membrane family protein [Rhodococcus sp. MTM3W5.2]
MIPALFVLYVVIEVAAVIWVGSTIGVLWTIALFLLGWAIGLVLVRSQGRKVIEGFRRAGRGTGSAGGAVADGAVVAAGTVLLVIPGLVTTALGLLLLIPPTRRVLRPLVLILGGRRLGMVTAAGGVGADVYARTRRRTVVDGVIVEDTIVEDVTYGAETAGSPAGTAEPLAIEGEIILPDPGDTAAGPRRAD